MIGWLCLSFWGRGWDLETAFFYLIYCLAVGLFFAILGAIRDQSHKRNPPPSNPMCPNYHGFNTGKITAIKRILEQSTYGWAAPSSGNTFECYSCGYKW